MTIDDILPPDDMITIDEGSSEEDPSSLIVTQDVLPSTLPILPIRERPVFPKMMAPVVIMNPKIKKMLLEMQKDRPIYIGLLLLKEDPSLEELILTPKSTDDFYHVGTVGKVIHMGDHSELGEEEEEDAPVHLMVQIMERFQVAEFVRQRPYFQAKVDYWYEEPIENPEETKAYSLSLISSIKELVSLTPLFQEELGLLMKHMNVNNPGVLADLSAFMTTASREELQEILETTRIRPRVEKALVLLQKEIEVVTLQNKISQRIEDRMSKQQREFFLREQLKEIKKELGIEKDGKESEVEKTQERVKKLTLSEEAQERVNEELEKLQTLEPSSPEYNVTRAYLDWLTILPWGKYSKDRYDLARASKVLDQAHYGLDDVKERILEFISVGKMNGNLSGSIILLVGPPGVGKTSIGQSIAKSLGRQFYRFSLGGMRDEAEIKGHRRTYIGALPGKFITAIKTCKTSNPVIMLDEVDKIGASYQGDPASALLEVLDPEQNQSFLDHYLDVRFDLSKVLFICTANQLESIPGPLLDRMEIIRLSGYITEEKIQIAKRHLIPKQTKLHGLKRGQVQLGMPVLREVIEGYAREAGVRSLENQIKKILRKSTKKLLQEDLSQLKITQKDLPALLGRRVFEEDQLFKKPRVGVVMGLAYTSLGGSTLYIEASCVKAKNGSFKQTGQLGKVMVESSEIAYTYVQSILADNEAFFREHLIHLHVPAGATPKDGPSAGISMACALYSLATQTPLNPGIAMTGELTLTGMVMPIGGVKEKLLAAKRAKVPNVIFPEDNRKDFDELEENVREGITPHFVQRFEEVMKICFEPSMAS